MGEDVKKLELPYHAEGNVKLYNDAATVENSWIVLQKFKTSKLLCFKGYYQESGKNSELGKIFARHLSDKGLTGILPL